MNGICTMLAVVFLPVTLALASPEQEQAPISLTARELRSGAEAKPELELECENRSGKVIAAYVVRIDDRDENGKLIARTSLTSMTRDLGFTKGRPGYQPGERWIERRPVVGGAPSREVVLDLVMFADGSHWGPNKANKLSYLLGVKAGAHLERAP